MWSLLLFPFQVQLTMQTVHKLVRLWHHGYMNDMQCLIRWCRRWIETLKYHLAVNFSKRLQTCMPEMIRICLKSSLYGRQSIPLWRKFFGLHENNLSRLMADTSKKLLLMLQQYLQWHSLAYIIIFPAKYYHLLWEHDKPQHAAMTLVVGCKTLWWWFSHHLMQTSLHAKSSRDKL